MNTRGNSRTRAWRGLCLAFFATWACGDDPPAPEPMDPVDPPSHCNNRRRDSSESGVDCGGGECRRCDLGDTCVRASDCRQGACVAEFCQDARCGNQVRDGNESDVDCGGLLCLPCADNRLCQIDKDCDSQVCGADGRCASPACDDNVLNGDEVELDCGGSCPGCAPGTSCRSPSDCASGLCVEARCRHACEPGSGDCDGDYANACETDTANDPLHCGACGKPCERANAEPACVDGACGILRCLPGYSDCNQDESDGCEIHVDRDPLHCGECDAACSVNNAMADCREGTCALTCDFGFEDCDHVETNGCEGSLMDDAENCGHCGTTCSSGTRCSSGTCGG